MFSGWGNDKTRLSHPPFFIIYKKQEGETMKSLNKYFVFSDVHGEYDALREALLDAGYEDNNPNHILVSLGDLFDRGAKSIEIFRFLHGRPHIAVKGNHDCFFQEYLEKGMDGEFVLFNILHNGLGATISSFTGTRENVFNVEALDKLRGTVNSTVLKWLRNMPLYFETENFIFCHGGLNPNISNWKNTDEQFILWDIEHSADPIPSTQKTVMIGHHHAFRVRRQMESRGYKPVPLNTAHYSIVVDGHKVHKNFRVFGNTDEHAPVSYRNKVAIDGCTNLTGKVNVVVVEDYPLDDKVPEEQPKAQEVSFGENIDWAAYTTTYTVRNDIGNMTFTI